MGRREFGELELAIAKVVRKKVEATVREVYDALGKKGSYTTIMTVMSRMFEKGELEREKLGRQYNYRLGKLPHKNLLRRIRERVFGGDKVAMVSYLLEEELTEEEFAAIESYLKKRRTDG